MFMEYKLGTNVKVGNKILLKTGWEKIVNVKDNGVETASGYIDFGEKIFGWKNK